MCLVLNIDSIQAMAKCSMGTNPHQAKSFGDKTKRLQRTAIQAEQIASRLGRQAVDHEKQADKIAARDAAP
jgi:hypothetical protein